MGSGTLGYTFQPGVGDVAGGGEATPSVPPGQPVKTLSFRVPKREGGPVPLPLLGGPGGAMPGPQPSPVGRPTAPPIGGGPTFTLGGDHGQGAPDLEMLRRLMQAMGGGDRGATSAQPPDTNAPLGPPPPPAGPPPSLFADQAPRGVGAMGALPAMRPRTNFR